MSLTLIGKTLVGLGIVFPSSSIIVGLMESYTNRNKILLGKRDYYGDEERRKAAEEFRNRNAQTTKE
ncbi:MAG TPA: hypothetical protein ENI23_04885 [bacterium]|nr:hypothetical protein [bacterium]